MMQMRNRIFLFLLCFAGMSEVFAQNGSSFPELAGEYLDGKQAVLPSAPRARMLIVGMAYSKKAEDDLRSWYQPMYDSFVLKRGIMDSMYDVDLCFVPMFTGMKKAAYETAMNQLRKENRSDLHPYILFYKGELEPYASVLNMNDKAKPYLFVVDQTGRIVFSTSGAFTERKKEQLESALDDSMK